MQEGEPERQSLKAVSKLFRKRSNFAEAEAEICV